MAYRQLEIPADTVLRPEFAPTPGERRLAERGIGHLRIADAPGSGGLGWALDPDARVRLAYMCLVAGRDEEAEAALRRVIDRGRPLDPVVFQLAGVMRRRGASEEEIAGALGHALDLHPRLIGVRSTLARRAATEGRADEAVALWDEALGRDSSGVGTLLGAARFFGAIGRRDRALELLDEARAAAAPRGAERADDLMGVAGVRVGLGDADGARSLIDEARAAEPDDPALAIRGAMLAAQLGDPELARGLLADALGAHEPPASSLADAATVLVLIGDVPGARRRLLEAAEALDDRPWELASIGARLRELGLATNDAGTLADAIRLYRRGVDLEPESPTLHHDLAFALFSAGEDDEAVEALERASTLAPGSAIFPDRLATMLERIGRPEEAREWRMEAESRRRDASQPTNPS
jgi:tetratricopeptide (TPR) repeat protein